MMGDREGGLWRSSWAHHAISATLVLLLLTVFCSAAGSASFSVNGVTFSDKLGGFVLEKATGEGSMDDPFVLVERLTDSNGGTLAFTAPMEFGNRIGSQHRVGFALIKVIENATDQPWTSFELELQSKLGVPSDDSDGLSFGQGSTAGRPFSTSGFKTVTIEDTPYDRVQCDQGRVPIGGHVTLSLVITLFDPLPEAYLLQRPGKPVAEAPAIPNGGRLAWK